MIFRRGSFWKILDSPVVLLDGQLFELYDIICVWVKLD